MKTCMIIAVNVSIGYHINICRRSRFWGQKIDIGVAGASYDEEYVKLKWVLG
jgi:hypothetical protein